MAWSLGARRLMAEVLGCAAVLAVTTVSVVHRHDLERGLAVMLGLPVSGNPATAAEAPATQSGNSPVAADHGDRHNSASRSVELTAKAHGHFFTPAEINGRTVDMLVDTGASMVALTYDDARSAGVLPAASAFTSRTNTANGIARVALIEIDRLTIGDIEIRHVQGAVMEDGKLQTSLLGMSFLGKLSRVDMQSGRLVLEE